jgi:hypothetical protein
MPNMKARKGMIMCKKKEVKESAGNGQEPKYKNDRGEEIEHVSESLYDEVTLQFSRFGDFLDVVETFGRGYRYGPKTDIGSDIFNLMEIGRALLKDIEQKFDRVYDFIDDQIGDVRIDSARYGQIGIAGNTLLKAYIETPVKTVSEARG